MSERLYYTDPNLTEFDATYLESRHVAGQLALVLDRTAFYPTSGGQLHDTGWLLETGSGTKLRVSEVAEGEDGSVLHYVETPADDFFPLAIKRDVPVRGVIDAPRRRDHMQQHTGQHLLSAVFIELLNAPTVSFHMGDENCTIDLYVKSLGVEQIREAERRCNEIITDDVPVAIKFATLEEACALGVRKIPADLKDTLRLIEIRGHDLTACGGTHVSRTGEIGSILLRKTEKVKQGVRVEFVCGGRAIRTARKDFETLTLAAALFSSHIYDIPEQIRKNADEAKAAGKRQQKTLAELAEFMAAAMLADATDRVALVSGAASDAKAGSIRLVKRAFTDRDVAFVKLLAQKLSTQPNVVALLGAASPQPSLVFAQSAGGGFDMGNLMKEAMAAAGGRGGGSRDMAQGGAPAGADVQALLDSVASKITNAS
jgi:alanyl-tRNA synthetase